MKWQYTRGLHEIGNGNYAWLQPDGSWGWSNAGLVTDGGASLLVDTLFDLKLTRDMLHAMRNAVPAAKEIATVVKLAVTGDTFPVVGTSDDGKWLHLSEKGAPVGWAAAEFMTVEEIGRAHV